MQEGGGLKQTIAQLHKNTFKRVLGVFELFAIGYGDLGSSIYYALGVTALFALGATPIALGLAGIVFICTALSYAEMTSIFHESGGSASYARHAFNDLVSFIAGYHTWANANRESDWKTNWETDWPVSLEDMFINSFSDYRKWEYDPTIKISLTRGREGLVWNIFQKITKESSFYHFQEATIPSLRCHPETIALIEKIKKEALSNPLLLLRFIREFKVDVISSEDFLKRHEKLSEWFRLDMILNLIKNVPENAMSMLGSGVGVTSITCSAVSSTTRVVSSFFNEGVLRILATGSIGLAAGALSLTASSLIMMSVLPLKPVDFFLKNLNSLNKRIKLLSSQIQSPVFIEVEPISEPSVIDERVRVSKFTWAVTLVTHTGMLGNHAQVIIEGINDGFYNQDSARIGTAQEVKIGEKFMHLADFSPQIQYGLLSPGNLKYETRTETWMRSSDQVKKMLEAIEATKYLPEDNFHPFNFWGIHSKIYKFNPREPFHFSGKVGDNCFTFLREKLKMIDIDIGESYLDLIAAIVKNYTRSKRENEMLPVQVMI